MDYISPTKELFRGQLNLDLAPLDWVVVPHTVVEVMTMMTMVVMIMMMMIMMMIMMVTMMRWCRCCRRRHHHPLCGEPSTPCIPHRLAHECVTCNRRSITSQNDSNDFLSICWQI
jgi:hypothetical protein